MTFWSSQTLKQKLPALITTYNASKVEQASYTLGIGQEIFITKDHHTPNSQHTKRTLSNNEAFVIPPGQFAFLLTEESVEVPSDAIAFISMKAGFKHKGLVNISGFHVDPGFKGKLLFSVYNAGPSPIHLSHNQPCFLIWYASLDYTDTNPRQGQGFSSFPTSVLNQISTDEIYSLQFLTSEFKELDHNVSNKLVEINGVRTEIDGIRIEASKWISFIKWGGSTAITMAFIFLTYIGISIFNLSKFAIEQREVVSHLVEYKDLLDELLKQKKLSQLPPANAKIEPESQQSLK